MKRLLWVSDFHNTGYSTVGKMFVRELMNRENFCVSVLAINHIYEQASLINEIKINFSKLENIWSIFPSHHVNMSGDEYTRESALNQILGIQELIKISKIYQPDIIFFLNDSLCAKYLSIRWAFPQTKFVAYIPIDSSNLPLGFLSNLEGFDMILTMTNISKNEFKGLTMPINVLYHPMNLDNYHRLDNRDKIREKWLNNISGKNYTDRFVILNVNMNQSRKRIDKTIEVYNKLWEKHKNILLILKTQNISALGVESGIPNIEQFIKEKYRHLEIMIIDTALPIDELNELYNCADVFLTTTIGEGWGYTPCEAILAGTNVLVPNHTAYLEIFDTIQTYRTQPIPWFYRSMNSEILNPHRTITYAKFTKTITKKPVMEWMKNLQEDTKIPTILISEFGKDSMPVEEIHNTGSFILIGNFKTLKYAKKFMKTWMPKTIAGTIHICIQIGKNFEILRNELFDTAQNFLFDESELTKMGFDLRQQSVFDLAQFIINNHLIDVDNCYDKLEKLYSSWTMNCVSCPLGNKGQSPTVPVKLNSSKKRNKKIINYSDIIAKQRKWFEEKCNISKLTNKLEEYLKTIIG